MTPLAEQARVKLLPAYIGDVLAWQAGALNKDTTVRPPIRLAEMKRPRAARWWALTPFGRRQPQLLPLLIRQNHVPLPFLPARRRAVITVLLPLAAA